MWPDIEQTYIKILHDSLDVRVADTVPDNVEELPGFIRVTRGPGDDDGVSDAPLVDLEVFNRDRGQAALLAERARQVMLGSSNQEGVLIDSVSTATGPQYVYYGDNVVRYVASYRVTLRRPRN